MSLSVTEMLESLDSAIADTSRWRPNQVALELVGQRSIPSLGGEVGQYLGDQDGRPVYGFTRRQCQRMRDELLATARADATGGAA